MLYTVVSTKNERGFKEWIQNKKETYWYPTIKL